MWVGSLAITVDISTVPLFVFAVICFFSPVFFVAGITLLVLSKLCMLCSKSRMNKIINDACQWSKISVIIFSQAS